MLTLQGKSHLPRETLEYIARWQVRLGLKDWEITVKVTNRLSKFTDAEAQRKLDRHRARLVFRPDLSLDFDGRRTIIHELLHVAHTEVDQAVSTITDHSVPPDQRGLAGQIYRNAYEPYIESLARALVNWEHAESDPIGGKGEPAKAAFPNPPSHDYASIGRIPYITG